MDNKKAFYNYHFLDNFEAGIVLQGVEVKALKDRKASFNDAYCIIDKGEIILKKFHISVKDAGDQLCIRDRKLLLKRKEIDKLEKAIKEKGLTIVPTAVYFTKTGLVKVNVSLAKGKKNYDKRESIKKKDLDRQKD